jgi:tetratricopeptide (TPR) repeat protein
VSQNSESTNHNSEPINPEQQEQVNQAYQAGQAAFERGQYREAIEHLAAASALAPQNSRQAGEIQIWLVTAYEAVDRKQEAIDLCQQLKQHPVSDVRQQSRQLLYILEAPKLQRPAEWLTQIPDLSSVSEAEAKVYRGSAHPSPAKRSAPPPEAIDLSQVNTKENAFVWIGLIAVGLILAGLLWLV